MSLPFTERCNAFSSNLDGGLEASQFVKVLEQCDGQIFTGYEEEKSLGDATCLDQIERVALECGRVIGSQGGLTVFTGCGTSGRIAYLVSQRYSSRVGRKFTYACAGGDSALLLSDELPEDDPALGRDDLTAVLKRGGLGDATNGGSGRSKSGYVVGVTCGLSAPYVAGQLMAAMASTAAADAAACGEVWNDASLLGVRVGGACVGFNPVAYSREIPLKNTTTNTTDNRDGDGNGNGNGNGFVLPGCNTFKNVVEKLESASTRTSSNNEGGNGNDNDDDDDSNNRQLLHGMINPVIGPEPVTGSSRMKGGSATMVILDALCLRALHHSNLLLAPTTTSNDASCGSGGNESSLHRLAALPVSTLVAQYSDVRERTYSETRTHLPAIMDAAAASLRARVDANVHGNGGGDSDDIATRTSKSSSNSKRSGRILYIGCGSAAALGCIDASEMPDTYGSNFDQTRGFVAGGWGAQGGGLGVHNTHNNTHDSIDEKLCHVSRLHRISLSCFVQDELPSLAPEDSVIVLMCGLDSEEREGETEVAAVVAAIIARGLGSTLSALVSSYSAPPSQVNALSGAYQGVLASINPARIAHTRLTLSDNSCRHIGHLDFAIKIMTNAVTTYAQAKGRGAVFRSLMVTAGPANDKIFMRCVRIISDTVGCTCWQAEKSLLASIHSVETAEVDGNALLLGNSREYHIQASILPEELRGQASFVLPAAILLASNYVTGSGAAATAPRWTVAAAKEALEREPNISVLLQQSMSSSSSSTAQPPIPPNSSPPEFLVGIDLGGTNVRAAAVDISTGRLLSQPARLLLKAPASSDTVSPEQLKWILRAVYKEAISLLESQYGPDSRGTLQPLAVGVGTPGQVDDVKGTITTLANYPEWRDAKLPVRDYLDAVVNPTGSSRSSKTTTHAKAPIYIFDDANSALVAETEFGSDATRTAGKVAMLTLGTGVGVGLSFAPHGLAGVVSGNRGLIEGGHAIAHLATTNSGGGTNPTVTPTSIIDTKSFPQEQCMCGQWGCLEVYCSGTGLGKGAARAGVGSSGEELLAAVKNGNNAAKNEFHKLTVCLAAAVVNLCQAYGTDTTVLLAGGLGAVMAPYVRESLAADLGCVSDSSSGTTSTSSSAATVVCPSLPSVAVASVPEPGIVGAAAGAYHRIKSDRKSSSSFSSSSSLAGVPSVLLYSDSNDDDDDDDSSGSSNTKNSCLYSQATFDGTTVHGSQRGGAVHTAIDGDCLLAHTAGSIKGGGGAGDGGDDDCSRGLVCGVCGLAGCISHLYQHHSNDSDNSDGNDRAMRREALLGAALVNLIRYYDPVTIYLSDSVCDSPQRARALLGAQVWRLYPCATDVTFEIVNNAEAKKGGLLWCLKSKNT